MKIYFCTSKDMQDILDHPQRKEYRGNKFYCKCENHFVAVDNTLNDGRSREFKTKNDAMEWLHSSNQIDLHDELSGLEIKIIKDIVSKYVESNDNFRTQIEKIAIQKVLMM